MLELIASQMLELPRSQMPTDVNAVCVTMLELIASQMLPEGNAYLNSLGVKCRITRCGLRDHASTHRE